MSLESSQERTEQERPRSAASAETEHSPVVEENDEGEQLAADVAPAPVLPNPSDLVALLLTWIRTPDWSTSQSYLRTHPELLTEAATQMLTRLTQHQPDQRVHDILTAYQLLLQTARQQGIEAAYQPLLHQEERNESTATKLEELQDQVIAWLQTADWETSQTYLQSHPQLLTDAAEQMMEALKRSQREQPIQAMIGLHQAVLQKARVEGIEIAYEQFLVSELETPLGDQAAANYQTLQDPAILNDAGMTVIPRYGSSGQEALKLIPPDSSDQPARLTDLGNRLRARYVRNGDVADLEAAITAYQQAVQATPADSPNWPARLTNLGNGLLDRYTRNGDVADLEAAITAYQQAVQATPADSPNRSAWLSILGSGLLDRYARSGDLSDLEAAITASQQAVQTTPPASPNWALWLNNLGIGLRARYAHSGDLTDLEAAITAYQQAVQATPSDSPNQPTLLNNLGNGLSNRYAHSGDLTDLEAAITAYQQAVQATSPHSPDWPAWLNNLGIGLRARYTRSGDLADLEAAITASWQAAQVTPPDSPDWPALLHNLGNGLLDRYARSGDLADLERSITAYQQAVQSTPSNSPDWPASLSILSSGLRQRYARSGDLADLERAITASQQAVQATPSDSPDWSARLTNLGSGLRDRYARSGDLTDLEAAITAYQQAVQATLPDSPDRSAFLTNVGNGLFDWYARSGDLTDLEAAITAYQQAVQATLPDSPDRSARLSNLGIGLRARYACSGDLTDLEAAITAWERSWSIQHLRFAALPVTYQLGQQSQVVEVASYLVTAYVEQAKQRHPHSPSVPRRALEIAEGSKSRLLTQLVSRGPLPLSSELSQEIAVREQQLLATLTALDTQELVFHDYFDPTQEEIGHLQRLQQRQTTLLELEDLWARIARIGPEGTAYVSLRRGAVPTWQEFTHQTKALGPTTVLLSLFTTSDRVLLFLLRAGWRTPRKVEVPLDQTGWVDLQERFFREVHRYQPGLQRRETWDQSLRPLLIKAQQHLGGVERLILAPAGIGHLLPWSVLAERAGWQTSSGQPLSLVTLPALGILPRLQQRSHMHVHTSSVLVVGNPRGDLPYAEAEANEVAERFGTKPLLGAVATKSAVQDRVPDATLIHLATHAFFDAVDPLESGIVLADGVLTAREVLQHRLHADLLVLSACESGQVGSLGGEELAGLSQAFLQAGVRSLLVSLWRVNDPATAAFIQAFYTARQAGADKALALRQAMTHMQQNPHWTHPYYWGAFVLLGDWD